MSKLRKKFSFIAAIAVGMIGISVQTARADVVIDDFSSPAPETYYSILPDPNPTIITTNLGGGISRTISLSVTSLVFNNSLTGQVGGGLFYAAYSPLSFGDVSIAYTYATPIDFIPNVPSGGEVGSLVFLGFGDNGVLGGNVPVQLSISTTSGTLTYTGGLPLASTPQTVSVGLTEFSGSGDLSSVTGLTIAFVGNQASDFLLDSISVTTPEPSNNIIPAPPAILLAIAGLPIISLRRLRSQSKHI